MAPPHSHQVGPQWVAITYLALWTKNTRPERQTQLENYLCLLGVSGVLVVISGSSYSSKKFDTSSDSISVSLELPKSKSLSAASVVLRTSFSQVWWLDHKNGCGVCTTLTYTLLAHSEGNTICHTFYFSASAPFCMCIHVLTQHFQHFASYNWTSTKGAKRYFNFSLSLLFISRS